MHVGKGTYSSSVCIAGIISSSMKKYTHIKGTKDEIFSKVYDSELGE